MPATPAPTPMPISASVERPLLPDSSVLCGFAFPVEDGVAVAADGTGDHCAGLTASKDSAVVVPLHAPSPQQYHRSVVSL